MLSNAKAVAKFLCGLEAMEMQNVPCSKLIYW